MSEKDTIYSTKVKQSGVFNFKDLYEFGYEWLVDEGYDVTEDKYTEGTSPGGKGKELDIEWSAYRKISDYFRFILKIKWRIMRMTDVEVEKEGTKIKMNKGIAEIKAKAILEKDYEHRWENRPAIKFLRTLYDRYLIRGRIDDYEEKLIIEIDELMAQLKAFLQLEGKR